ncbi:MAG: M48 family metalloprotease [Candidatus Omnitrophica bacterium]|nr:M48 family metalloprotease [Candidatus Omnitrophota bacterium]
MYKRIEIIAFSLLLGGCVTFNPATQKKEVILISDANEMALGRQVAKSLAKKEKLYRGVDSLARVEKVGFKVASVSDRQNVRYEFHILDNKELNAVSLPGGFVYINKGLLDKLNDDELAFVLGHEVGHVAARHAVKKLQANLAFDLLMNITLSATQAGQLNGAASAARATGSAYNLISLGYSRKDEYFADLLGLRYAFKAGFSPNGAISALEKIKKEESVGGVRLLTYLRTHPYVDDRIKVMRKNILDLTGNTVDGAVMKK